MTRTNAARLVVPALTLTLLVALTGCGKSGALTGTGSLGSTSPSSPAASTSGSTSAADDPSADAATLGGISQDLDSADTANTEAGSNAASGDQAGATGDEP